MTKSFFRIGDEDTGEREVMAGLFELSQLKRIFYVISLTVI